MKAWAVVLLLLGLVGCKTSDGGDCAKTEDCVSGLVCVNLKCMTKASDGGDCAKTEDCVSGLVCVNLKCMTKATAKCATGYECHSSGLCAAGPDGSCRPTEEGCAASEGCPMCTVSPDGLLCVRREWVRIPGGTFQMGDSDEGPIHTVTVGAFEMAPTEVTVAQYRACVDAGRCTPPDTRDSQNELYCNWGQAGREKHPVNCVDWDQANAYARWVGGRLPTEAEWEYAARAGTTTRYSSGDTEADLERVAWCEGFSEARGTRPVGELPANAWGLHDMHGNVGEWVSDYYGPYLKAALTDPQGPATGETRVARSGNFMSFSKEACGSAARQRAEDKSRFGALGFRVVRPVP